MILELPAVSATENVVAQRRPQPRGVVEGDVGLLRIVSSTSWAVHPLVGLIGEFRRLRPQVRFEVTDPAARSVVLDQVRTGQVDFGLVDGPPAAGPLASLVLAEQQLLAVLPPGRGPQQLTATIDELLQHGLIGTPRGTALRDLLDGPDRPTAVLCFSDALAAAVLRAAEDAGLRVPDDLSVVGFDDTPLARRMRPPLTTVHQDAEEKGRLAAAELAAAVARHRAGEEPEVHRLLLPTELVVRGSTAPPPA